MGSSCNWGLALLLALACAAPAAAQSLVEIEITGPAELLEGEVGRYTVHATYDNEMDFEVVLFADLSVSPEIYAGIDRFGLLTAEEVATDQIVTVHASFTDGITLEAEFDVTILSASPLQCDFPTYERTQTFGGSESDTGRGFATDAWGNTWVLGSFEGVVDFDPGDGEDIHEATGAEDVFVTRFDAQGSYRWTRTLGGSGSDLGWGIAVDDQANVIVTGSFQETVDFDPGPEAAPCTSNGGSDIFVLKLDESGAYVWVRTIGGILDDGSADVAVDDQNDVIAIGHFQHRVDFDPTDGEDVRGAGGGEDIFALKLGGNGSYQWAYTVGGLQADEALGVAADADGDVVLTGRFRRSFDFDPGDGQDVHQAIGGSDAFVTRLGPDGAYHWTYTAGGVSTDGAFDVSVTALGETALTGYFWETVDFDPSEGLDERTSAGQSDVFVTWLRPDGSYRWTRTFGGVESDDGLALSLDPTGNVLVAGQFRGAVDFDPDGTMDEHASNGGSDAFVAKLRSDGAYQWVATVGGEGNDAAAAITTDAQGLIRLAGSFQGVVDFDPTDDAVDERGSVGSSDVFTLDLQCGDPGEDDQEDCYSPAFLWAESVGGPQADSGYRVASDGCGGWWVTGAFQGTVDFDPGEECDLRSSAGQEDIFVTRLQSDGSCVWTQTFGGEGSDLGLGIGVDAQGSVFVTGLFESTVDFNPGPSTDLRTSNGGTDAFVVKLNGDGTHEWARSVGGAEDDEGTDLAVDPWGDVVVCGSYQHEVDFDPTASEDFHGSYGDRDIFVLKLGADGSYGWAYTVGGMQADEALAVTVDANGAVCGAGRFRRTVDFDPGPGVDSRRSAGGTDVFVTCLGRDCSYNWTRTIGGVSTDGAYGVSAGGDGEFFVTGYFWDAVDFDPTDGVDEHVSSGQSDVFVTKLGPDGTYGWTRTVGGPLIEEGLATQVDDSGGTLVTGHFRGSIDFDPTAQVDEHTSVGGEDIFLLKVRADGTYAWTATVGGVGNDWGQGIAWNPNGRIMLTGFFSEIVDFDTGDGVEECCSNGLTDAFGLALRCWPGQSDREPNAELATKREIESP